MIHYLCFCETIELRKQHIINLSDTQLTTEQINLLSRGLKFIPTPVMKENQIRRQLISDFNQFARRMRLQYVYHDQNTEQHPFHVKSSWIPPIQRSVALETYLEEVKIKIAELHWLNLKIICHPARNELSRSLLTTKKLFSKKKVKALQPSTQQSIRERDSRKNRFSRCAYITNLLKHFSTQTTTVATQQALKKASLKEKLLGS